MIEKAIENWLINTNEINYLVAFCQVLLNEGHHVFKTHGPLEHGKDVISIDSNNNYFAFQLKGGDINTTEYGKIKSQIDELVEISIDHPSFDPDKLHKSYLVTNGLVDSFANEKINKYNKEYVKRGYEKLNICDKNNLLKIFIDAQGKFIPKEFDDFYLFLDLLTLDGKDFLPKEQFLDFLDHIIFKKIPKRKSDRSNAISSSLIIVSYLLDPFQRENNYYALFEAWTCLASSVIRFVERTKLKEELWIESFNLILSEIERNLLLLKEEILSKTDFAEGSIVGENRKIYNSRILMVIGTLAALEIYYFKSESSYIFDNDVFKLIKDNINNLFFWGESAFPYYFNLIKYLELNKENDLAEEILEDIFIQIIEKNQPRNNYGIANPYYSAKDVLECISRLDLEIESIYALLKEIIDIDTSKTLQEALPEIMNVGKNPNSVNKALLDVLDKSNLKNMDFKQFCGSSFVLESLILMLVRRDKKDLLEKNWHDLSNIFLESFEMDNTEDLFAWFTQNGKYHEEYPDTPAKWSDLVGKANKCDEPFYTKNDAFLHFFILTYPHRFNTILTNYLDMKL
ncbi:MULTISPECIES: hypothetical protein [Methanobacterium]|uniref:Uncharacterized protein n=1 Tax=Methanobacterium bryantii TaxID=2161 RepID=A0A2A2H8K0_METBR|nr:MULTISPECIES: hypothetical protein [Methanobacterium]OEC84390.1 hypothetical protein A9507_02295 [Methanobacterium sp. A39]PAV05614.1 hypothetical protein ASJ80_08885 [Methanobacterium bryantii]